MPPRLVERGSSPQGFHASPATVTCQRMTRNRDIITSACWGLAIASIMLNSLNERDCLSVSHSSPYFRPCLTALHIGSFLLASFAAGIILVEASSVIYGCIGALTVALLTSYGSLTLPVYLTASDRVLIDFVSSFVIIRIFVVVFPFLPLLMFLGAILGSMLAQGLAPEEDKPRGRYQTLARNL